MKENYVQRATRISKEIHQRQNEQKRWNGDDYYDTHIIGVRIIVLQNAKDVDETREMQLTALETIALLHDTVEDAKDGPSVLAELKQLFPMYIWEAVIAITKNQDEEYVDYLKRVKENTLATLVKIADLTHNMSDLKKGQRKAKYSLALYILTH